MEGLFFSLKTGHFDLWWWKIFREHLEMWFSTGFEIFENRDKAKNALKTNIIFNCNTVFAFISTSFVRWGCNFTSSTMLPWCFSDQSYEVGMVSGNGSVLCPSLTLTLLGLNLPLVRLPCEQLITAVSSPVIGRLGLSLAKVYGTWFQRKIMQLEVKLSLKTELALISINTL